MRSDDEVAAIAVACELPDEVELTEREREIAELVAADNWSVVVLLTALPDVKRIGTMFAGSTFPGSKRPGVAAFRVRRSS